MSFVFSDELEELRRTVRAFLEQKSPESEVRRLMESEPRYDESVWKQMAEQLGLQGLAIPEEHGGSGFTFVELCVVLEEMGRVLLCAPFFSTVVLAANTLLLSGDDAAKQEWLPKLASGEAIATLALAEESGSWDCADVAATAVASGDGWSLTGTKSFVLDGGVADLVLVAARTAAGVSLFAVRGDAPGVTRTALSTLDMTRPQARIELAGAPATLVGTEGDGAAVIDQVLDLAAVAFAAEQVGGAQFVLDMAAAYAKDRVQFGRPIGSFQAIKHKCANMLMLVETAKSAALHAAGCAGEASDELPEAAALAKVWCSEAYLQVSADNIQVHGGMGYTWEHPAHLYYRRAKSTELLFGDPGFWRARLGARIGVSV
jgi:alkylation response protein AidB-like acyl-CoA dehydrogenase